MGPGPFHTSAELQKSTKDAGSLTHWGPKQNGLHSADDIF